PCLAPQGAVPRDGGQYLCTAANALGSARLLVTLAVRAHPPRIAGRGRPLTAHSGSSAALPCRAEGSPPPRISWLLANGTELGPGSAGGGRARVEPDGTLLIRAVTVYDRGTYTCLARNEKRQSVAGTAGQSLSLPCTVQGKPEPSVHWVLPAGTVLKPLQGLHARLLLLANGTLLLGSIAPSDSGTYECIATSSTGSDRRVVSLVVQRRETPPKIAVASQELTRLNFGERLLLNCTASGEPKPRIIWRLPSKALADDSGHRARRYVLFHNGTLYLNKAGVAEGGDYTCYAQNTLGRDEMKIHVAVIVAAPQIKHNHKTHVTVTAGDAALLDCEAAGEPRAQIFWVLPSSERISSSTARHSLHANGSLSISQASLLDAGEYLCVARNPGGDDSKLYKLDVAAKPPIINGLHRNKTIMKVTAVRHSKKHIDCRAEGTPPPQIIKPHFPPSLLAVQPKTRGPRARSSALWRDPAGPGGARQQGCSSRAAGAQGQPAGPAPSTWPGQGLPSLSMGTQPTLSLPSALPTCVLCDWNAAQLHLPTCETIPPKQPRHRQELEQQWSFLQLPSSPRAKCKSKSSNKAFAILDRMSLQRCMNQG
uniref:Immunoglobulin superfamily member 10 n=1 Tax=Serinus canaria TaxID=9135 RepID=A0A8C9UD07_SERCA